MIVRVQVAIKLRARKHAGDADGSSRAIRNGSDPGLQRVLGKTTHRHEKEKQGERTHTSKTIREVLSFFC